MLLRIVHLLGSVPRFSADKPRPVVYIPDAVPPTKRRGMALPYRKKPVIRVSRWALDTICLPSWGKT